MSYPATLHLEPKRPQSQPPTSVAIAETGLAEDLRAGSEAAFETLVRNYAGRLLAVARHLLRNEEDARDAVQEAFLAAFRSIQGFRGGSSLSTWLHRIVINVCLMKLRAGSRHPETSIDELLPRFDGYGRHASPVSPWPVSAETTLLERETRERIRASIGRLPVRYRTILILRDIEELDTAEVAQILCVSPNAVKVRLHRARLALRTLLEPVFGPRRAESVSVASTSA